jgi:hypothetical protein
MYKFHLERHTDGVGESTDSTAIDPILVEVLDVVLGNGSTNPLRTINK